jgi:hypothetical protein
MTEPFRFSSGLVAYSVQDLIGVCHKSPQEVIYYLNRGDFEKWLAYIGEENIAKKVEEVHYSSVSDEEKLKQFIAILQPPQKETLTATPSPENTISPPNETIIPSNESTSNSEVENIDATAQTTETSSITEEKEATSTPEIKESTPKETTTESQKSTETSSTPEVKESTPKETTTESQKSTETSSTPEVKESTPKETLTESQQSTEIKETVTQKTEIKEAKPMASMNEYSDESPKANSSFAKAVKDFISRYISK